MFLIVFVPFFGDRIVFTRSISPSERSFGGCVVKADRAGTIHFVFRVEFSGMNLAACLVTTVSFGKTLMGFGEGNGSR
jgi:hypothetical protein